MKDTFFYFAYGSNMSTERLQDRVASARPCGIGKLEGYALRWHKLSNKDGTGKCDAEKTENDSDVVWGVLFEIDCCEKRRLDKAEGLHHGYEEKEVDIVTDQGIVNAWIYYAACTHIDPSLLPYQSYKDFVVRGAIQHGLPEPYIHCIRKVLTTLDKKVD